MFCKNCGAQISDNAKFCKQCGARQEKIEENIEEKIGNKLPRKMAFYKFENKYVMGIICAGLVCLVVLATIWVNTMGTAQDCEAKIDHMIQEQDQSISESMTSAIDELLLDDGMLSDEDLAKVHDYINMCADEWTEAILSGRSEVKYKVLRHGVDEIELSATVENADLEESIEDFVAEAISNAFTLDRKTVIKGVVKGLFDISETDWENHPDQVLKLINESVCESLKDSINSASRRSSTGTFVFEKRNGEWVLTSGDNLDEFWSVVYGVGYDDYDNSYYGDEYYDDSEYY